MWGNVDWVTEQEWRMRKVKWKCWQRLALSDQKIMVFVDEQNRRVQCHRIPKISAVWEKKEAHNITGLRCVHGFERWYRKREKGSACVEEKRDPCSHSSKNLYSWWWTRVETIGSLVEVVSSLNPGICGRFEPSRQGWVAPICFRISQSRHHQVFRETSYPEGSYGGRCGTRETEVFTCVVLF